jgi:hypothetical protein
MIFNSSLKMLNTMKKHLNDREGDDPRPGREDPEMETARTRVDWAISVAREMVDNFEELLQDLRQSYTAVLPFIPIPLTPFLTDQI